MLAGSALQTAYSFINAIWVGQFLGTEALAAVTDSFPVIFVLIAVGAGMTMGTGILISQHYGARDMAAVRRVVDSSTILILVLSLVLTAAGEIFTPQILRAMDTKPEVMPLAAGYMRIFLLSLPLVFGLFLTRSMLQGIGDSRTPLYFQAAGVLLSTLLDPILMFGWLGFPKLGLNGTAWATLVGQHRGAERPVWFLRRRRNPASPALAWKGMDWRTTWTIIRIGAPAAVQQSLISVSMVFVIGIVNGFGKEATAAFGAGSRVDQLAFMPALTFSMAVSTLAGQNIGAGRYDRIRAIFLWGCLLSGGVTLVASILAVGVPQLLIRIFTPDAATIDMGADYLRIVGACYLFFAVMFVANGIINGSGHTLVTTIISLVSLWVVRVPVANWLSARTGVNGVWYAMALSFAVSMVASLAYYLTGWWRRPVVRLRPAPATPEAVFGEETGEA